MFIHDLNPVLLSIGSLEIRYYGLFYVIGFIIFYLFMTHLVKEREIDLKKDDVLDLLVWVIVLGIIGARLFHVFFYNPSYYLANPTQIFAIWQGGLAFHGGLLGALLAAYIFSKRKKIHLYDILDIGVIPVALGLMLGRIGNFINGELYGRITDLPWGVKFQGAEGFRHPSQIYESLKNLAIFGILWNLRNKRLRKGTLFWLFVTLYGLLRFLVEFFREPAPEFGFVGLLSIGQILSLAMLGIGVIMILVIYKKKTAYTRQAEIKK